MALFAFGCCVHRQAVLWMCPVSSSRRWKAAAFHLVILPLPAGRGFRCGSLCRLSPRLSFNPTLFRIWLYLSANLATKPPCLFPLPCLIINSQRGGLRLKTPSDSHRLWSLWVAGCSLIMTNYGNACRGIKTLIRSCFRLGSSESTPGSVQ